MKLPNFKSSPDALIRCDECGQNVSYFFDGGSFTSDNGEVFYICEKHSPEYIERKQAERDAEIASLLEYDQIAEERITEHLKRCGVMDEGALTKCQALSKEPT